MKLEIKGKAYNVITDNNVTAEAIAEKLPLHLEMVRYAGHEYYAELPFKPASAGETTSNIKAGHIYYWDGWNAFVINFGDADITPYKAVHVGRIDSDDIARLLLKSPDNILTTVR